MFLSPKILIVDDEPRMCDSLRFLLNYQGYEIETSRTGTEAVERLTGDQFDLILLDVVMPDMNGYKIMEYARSATPDTPVIVMTSYASLESAVEAMRGGAFDYVMKPLDFDEFLRRVNDALRRRRRIKDMEVVNRRLKRSERRLRYLIHSSPDFIYTLDSVGKFTFVNRTGGALLGCGASGLIGEHYSAVVYEEDLQRARYCFHERRTGNRSATGVELRLKSKHNGRLSTSDGKTLLVELNAKGLYDKPVEAKEKQFLGTLGIARDVTDRRRFENRLLYAQKMETISTLAGGIAHEFNNLLQVILGYSELLLLQKRENEPGYKELQEITRSARKGGALTQQLLTFSRKADSKREPTDINLLVKRFSGTLLRTFPTNVHVEFSLARRLRPVLADADQLEQLFMNLAMNAKDAMRHGGKLRIRTANVTINESPGKRHITAKPGHYVLLSLSDTGVGMDRETRKHIFEPFFTTKEPGHGTGLGLSAAYGIVKIHGGYITCESKSGAGTTFNVFFPSPLHLRGSSVALPGPEEAGTKNILLVDDEVFLRELGKRILDQSGYRVMTAPTGEEALELYRSKKERIDLVLLDLVMPNMGGLQCLKRLLQLDPSAKVLLAGHATSEEPIEALLAAGATGFIGKPYKQSELLAEVQRVLNQHND